MSSSSYTNVVNGLSWKSKTKNFQGKDVLPIFLFTDDFEINNPLGSHSGSQSNSAIFYSFPTLPSWEVGKLNKIFLGGLFKSIDIKSCGQDASYVKLIEEMQDIERNGIVLNINNETIRVSVD